MRLLAAFVAALLLGPTAAAHGEDDKPTVLQLGPARVLASPGTPEALDAFLPGETRPERLTWPLPDGPLVVLGLPEHDEVARQVADAFQLEVDDLEGGYRIAAWDAGERALVIVMAADAAALGAARFEFDADAPRAMLDPDMRSLDFKSPNERAGCAVRAGTRLVRPLQRLRGWDPRATGRALRIDDVATAAGAHANRMWIDADELLAERNARTLQDLRSHGVEPVGVLDVPFACTTPDDVVARAQTLAPHATHFALVFAPDDGRAWDAPEPPAIHEAALARRVAAALGPALLELTVVPSAADDRRASARGAPLRLDDLPVAVIGWRGPEANPLTISAEAARARAESAGCPVVLLDGWALAEPGRPYLATLPRGRDLGTALAGTIVLGAEGTQGSLEGLWETQDLGLSDADLLTELLPTTADAATWHTELVANLQRADTENLGLVPWMAPLAAELEAGAAAAKRALLAVPNAAPFERGESGETSWAMAPSMPLSGAGLRLRAAHEGLELRVDAPGSLLAERELFLRIEIRRPGTTRGLRIELTAAGWILEGGVASAIMLPPTASGEAAMLSGALRASLTLDRFALGGDAHPGRAFEVRVSWGPETLWPVTSDGAFGLVLITR
ncbi:MAG: hypothetical protein O2894_05930 [Planctomycetota bacterium]|nr:hypothetical protein [Planctomycetota bacterium]